MTTLEELSKIYIGAQNVYLEGSDENKKYCEYVWYLIKKFFPEYIKYGSGIIKDIYRYPDPDKYNKGNLLVTTNCKYCLNLGREHSSNHVYFHIGYRKNVGVGICQKCLSPTENYINRKNGLCKDFSSKIYPIPFDIQVLFGFGVNEKDFRTETHKTHDAVDRVPIIPTDLLQIYPDIYKTTNKTDIIDITDKSRCESHNCVIITSENDDNLKKIEVEEIKRCDSPIQEIGISETPESFKKDVELQCVLDNEGEKLIKTEKIKIPIPKQTQKQPINKKEEPKIEKKKSNEKKKLHEDDPLYIINPESKQYVLRSGPTGKKILGILPEVKLSKQPKNKTLGWRPSTPQNIVEDQAITCGFILQKLDRIEKQLQQQSKIIQKIDKKI